MLNIDRVTMREIRLPLKEPFRLSQGVVAERRIILVQLKDMEGIYGWGECVALEEPIYSEESTDTAWTMIRDFIAPRVLSREFEEPDEIHPFLERDIRGNNMAKAAVEMAAWELAAQLKRKPLAELLGGKRKTVATGISLGMQDNPDTLAKMAAAAREEGYRKIKIKIAPGADIQFVRTVVAELGFDAPTAVDANCAYTLDDIHQLRKLDEFDLVMIEQPLAWDDLRRHAELQKELLTPICLDESITSLARTEDMIAMKSAKIVNIKPGRVGGFVPAMKIHDLCAENDIPVWCGGMLETGIGRAHNVALASLDNFSIPGDLSPSARYWEQDIVDPEWTMDAKGNVTVPLDRPGMGVTVDEERVEDLAVRTETLTRA